MNNAVRVRLSLMLRHRTVELPEQPIDAAQTISINIGNELAARGLPVERQGYAVLDYTANSAGGINAYSQVINESKSLSFSFPFMRGGAGRTGPLDAVAWYYDHSTDAFVSLLNTTDQPVTVTPSLFINGQAQTFPAKRLRPRESATIKLPEPATISPNQQAPSIGVRLAHNGASGAVIAQGWAMNAQRGFSTAFTFHHQGTCPCPPVQSRHLYGAGVAIGNNAMMGAGVVFNPYLALRNNSGNVMLVRPVFSYNQSGSTGRIYLPSLTLGPQETALRNLRQYQLAGIIPASVHDGDIDLEYDSPDGSLIAELASVDSNGSFVSGVPLTCSGQRALHIAYWRTDGDWDSMLTIKNIAPEANQVEITISYPGGLYVVEKMLAAGATAMISVKELQRNQTPDREGRTIPANATTGGMNVWSLNVNKGLVINGMAFNPVTRTCGYCGGFGIVSDYQLTDTPGGSSSCYYGYGFNDREFGDDFPVYMQIQFDTNQCGTAEVTNIQISTPDILQPGFSTGTVDVIGAGTGVFSAQTVNTFFLDEGQCNSNTGQNLTANGTIVAKPRIRIHRDGNEITPQQTQNVIVGQKISLTATVQGATQNSQNQLWTIPGSRVKEYQIMCTGSSGPNGGTLCQNPTSAAPVELTELNQQSIGFYWWQGGNNQEVQYRITVNGIQYSFSATFNVATPTGNVSLIPGENGNNGLIDTELSFGNWFLTYGVGAQAGIRLRPDVQVPSGYNGSIQWVQTYKLSRRLQNKNNTWVRAQREGVDQTYPYPFLNSNIFPSDMEDRPRQQLTGVSTFNWKRAEVDDSAKVWLMFQPSAAGSIWVPLRKIEWAWSAVAVKNGSDQWVKTASNVSGPAYASALDFPVWSANVKDVSYTPE
jgi:hypothetical protein